MNKTKDQLAELYSHLIKLKTLHKYTNGGIVQSHTFFCSGDHWITAWSRQVSSNLAKALVVQVGAKWPHKQIPDRIQVAILLQRTI
jgi:hypothetical protein